MNHYSLVAEDLIQKIKISPLRPYMEVPFRFHTAHSQLLNFYEEEYTIHTSREVPQDDDDHGDDGHNYWDDMGDEEYHNVVNMMEG